MNRRLIFVAAILVLVGVLIWLGYRPPVAEKKLTPDDRLALIGDKNTAMGYLENGDYLKAVPILTRITEAVPADPLGHRNLVVALFQPNDFGQSALASADGTVDLLNACLRLLKVDGEASISLLLSGRAFAHAAELARSKGAASEADLLGEARKYFDKSAKLAANDPAPLFDLYLMEKALGDPQRISDAAFAALRKSGVRAQENLAFLIEWLEQLTLRKSPDAASALDQLLRVMPSDSDTPRKLLFEAQALIAKQSAEAYSKVVAAHNYLKTHASYLQDRSRLLPHPLGFTISDFRPAFYAGLPKEEEPGIAVKFSPFTPPGSGDGDIWAAAWSVLSVEHTLDSVRLGPGSKANSTRIDVNAAKTTWQNPFEIDGVFHHFQLTDLDLDIKPGKDRNIPADMDIVLWGANGLRVLENREENAKRRWIDRTQAAKVSDLKTIQWLTVCDMDHDGNLDLVVGLEKGIRILRNRGEWAFDDITSRSPGFEALETTAAVYGDFHRDGDLDFFVLDKSGRLILLENRRSGKFIAKRPEALDPRPGIGTNLLTFDANNDGFLDLLIGQAKGATLYQASREAVLPQGSHMRDIHANAAVIQSGYWDYDNDGWSDVWLLTKDEKRPLRIFRNIDGERFDPADHLLPPLKGPLHSIHTQDADSDGDQDLLFIGEPGVSTPGGPTRLQGLRNDGGNQNHWLDLRLRAILNRDAAAGIAAKSNYFDIGGLIELRSGPFYQMQQVSGPITHFGLGRRKQADLVRVFWTNGVTQAVLRPSLNQVLAEEQKPKGSCPFLFTWNGREFVFVTDCLFAKDLGLKPAEGVAPDFRRQNTYAVISADQLKSRDGYYVLQFTDELWEIPYLDLAKLLAVDHPADVEICTNQRVPANDQEPFRIRSVRNRRTPLSARAGSEKVPHESVPRVAGLSMPPLIVPGLQRPATRAAHAANQPGRVARPESSKGVAEFPVLSPRPSRTQGVPSSFDSGYVSDLLRHRDGRCLGGFSQVRYVGVAEPHWLELDLGDLSKAKHATLYLTGWKRPTDTTANVALSQDPRFDNWRTMPGGIQSLSLLVPDGRGGWNVANPNVGFPPGIMQTLAIDLPLDKFPPHDFRVRLATARELYWDDAFFTVDDSAAGLRIQTLNVAKADLHYRGFSRTIERDRTQPREIHYGDVDPAPHWRPIQGPFTGYGDTTPLLHHPDCQYVIMSPGDELTLQFKALPEPPAGWRRTFIFHAAGWLKGFDFNGLETEQTEPLPFDGMTAYPPNPAERHPHLDQLKQWLTRKAEGRRQKAVGSRQLSSEVCLLPSAFCLVPSDSTICDALTR